MRMLENSLPILAAPSTSDIMGFELLPDNRTLIKHHYRRADGTKTTAQVTIDSQDKRKISVALLELVQSIEGKASEYTYQMLSKRYRDQRGDGGMKSVYDISEKKIGKYKIDKRFLSKYDEFISDLQAQGKSTNTVSNYKSIVQRVLNYAYERRLIQELPIRDFGIKREFRDRVWRGDEQIRFWNKVAELDSHLQYALRLAEHRPIRKMDIAPLTTDNLILIGNGAPYIRFRPKKTSESKPRDTYLPLLDRRTGEPFDAALFDYLVSGRPAGCPYLFPRIGTAKNGETSKLKEGNWEYLGDFKNHFEYICTEAEISDLHFHDFKHIALTSMVKAEGWTLQDIKDLGIQYSDKAIAVYLHLDAEDALGKICRPSFVEVQGADSKASS